MSERETKTEQEPGLHYMVWLQTQSCTACGVSPVDVHHVKTRGSGGSNHPSNIIPLCREHHTESHTVGVKTFAKKYGIDYPRDTSRLYHKYLEVNGILEPLQPVTPT